MKYKDEEEKVTEYSYDEMGNKVKESISYVYDLGNKLVSEQSSEIGITEYEYDANGNVLKLE